ncbi:hypothetical protein A2714_02210 [Candidatus Woesebacteria bacterium RIFCSPHIGHO2_01_FULL_38_9]|uniref:Uncharacterized protein n=1 Tax=Candidatus Woesebacteria bacterium RIFCSPHIGHO2_01_FULL_38_9 TaxID=1802492 RepID=A0A1F7Y2W9_9BACT|nr:MAG: hypothetical protein A2714_02210 [Candidatus Woesebacteria bacterium RIFCSPHIGHO2_01_FULL_38_9]
MPEITTPLRQSGIEGDGIRGQMVVLPSRKPIPDWQNFWRLEDQKLFDLAGQKGDSNPPYWSTYVGTAERPFRQVVIPSVGEFSGYVKIIQGGRLEKPIYSAIIDTRSPVDEPTREQIARLVIPSNFFEVSAR